MTISAPAPSTSSTTDPVRLVYFAWVRERVGAPEEDVALPASVVTAGDLVRWLKERGEGYAEAFQRPEVIRVAVDRRHVAHGDALGNAREIALFPPMTGG